MSVYIIIGIVLCVVIAVWRLNRIRNSKNPDKYIYSIVNALSGRSGEIYVISDEVGCNFRDKLNSYNDAGVRAIYTKDSRKVFWQKSNKSSKNMWCGIIAIVAVSIILLTVFRIISKPTLMDRAKQVISTIYESARDAESG